VKSRSPVVTRAIRSSQIPGVPSAVTRPARWPRIGRPARAILPRVQLRSLALLAGALAAAFGCAPSTPPRWAEGGAPLLIPAAHWDRGDADAIDVKPDGDVLEGGRLIFKLDRVGRAVDEDYEPVALLLPDGRVAGPDNYFLGQVGVTNASPPFAGSAWLSVLPNGQVVFYDQDGARASGGQWAGCSGAALRTCTYVTHLVVLRNYSRRDGNVSVGVGVGVGVGY